MKTLIILTLLALPILGRAQSDSAINAEAIRHAMEANADMYAHGDSAMEGGPWHVQFNGRYFPPDTTRAQDSDHIWWLVADTDVILTRDYFYGYGHPAPDSAALERWRQSDLQHARKRIAYFQSAFLTRYGETWRRGTPLCDSVTYLLYYGHNAPPILR